MGNSDPFLAHYRKGVPLNAAALYFAPEKLKQEYELACNNIKARAAAEIRERAHVLRTAQLDEPTRINIADTFRIDLQELGSNPSYMRVLPGDDILLNERPKHPTEFASELYNCLLDSIRSGKFAALGYELPRTTKSTVVRIPEDIVRSFSVSDLYGPDVSLDGLTIVAVHLVLADSLSDKGEQIATDGRPALKAECCAAYNALRASGNIVFGDRPQVVKKAVRAKLKTPPTDATIWVHVKQLHSLTNADWEKTREK